MASSKKMIGLMVGVLIASVLFLPLVTTVNGNTGTQSVTNETVTVSTDEYTDLDGYDIDESSVVVYGYNDTSDSYEQAASGDYDLNPEPGEIKANSSSTLIDDGEDVKVSYDYQATGGLATTVLVLVPLFGAVAIVGVLGQEIQGMM
jgi:hypothetical protein